MMVSTCSLSCSTHKNQRLIVAFKARTYISRGMVEITSPALQFIDIFSTPATHVSLPYFITRNYKVSGLGIVEASTVVLHYQFIDQEMCDRDKHEQGGQNMVVHNLGGNTLHVGFVVVIHQVGDKLQLIDDMNSM